MTASAQPPERPISGGDHSKDQMIEDDGYMEAVLACMVIVQERVPNGLPSTVVKKVAEINNRSLGVMANVVMVDPASREVDKDKEIVLNEAVSSETGYEIAVRNGGRIAGLQDLGYLDLYS